MKRVVALLLPLLLFSTVTAYAGGDRVQRRASRFAEQELRRNMYVSESYSESDMVVDSAFVSYYNDPVILAEAARILELEGGGRARSSSLQERVNKHKTAINNRMSELNVGEFFGWEIRNYGASKSSDRESEAKGVIIIADKSFDNCIYMADLGNNWNSYTNLVRCVDDVVAEIEFKAALKKTCQDVSVAAGEAFDKLCIGAEKAAKVVKKEGKVVLEGVKVKGAEVAEDFSAGVERLVERVATEMNKEK